MRNIYRKLRRGSKGGIITWKTRTRRMKDKKGREEHKKRQGRSKSPSERLGPRFSWG